MYKYELHVHTSECDLVVKERAAEIVRLYKDAGYDGIVITDHYFSTFFDWFSEELQGADHKKIIDRWLLGYRNAQAEGEKLGLTVLPGAEVRLDGCSNDYLIYGADEDFFYRTPLLNRCSSLQELVSLLPEHVCIVQAHPFRSPNTPADPTLLFGIEVYNGRNDPRQNALAKEFAARHEKPMTSGSDFHYFGDCAKGGIVTDTPISSPKALSDILRSGKYHLMGV